MAKKEHSSILQNLRKFIKLVKVKGQTFEQIMHSEKGNTSGFDYLRIGLALAVLGVHVVSIADHHVWVFLWTSWLAPIELTILPAFFVLSGFLVTGSLMRNSIPQFIALRVARILPALLVEVTLSAILLGGLVTTLPIQQYIASSEFHSYFFNILGYIHYTLPGVFGGLPINTQLWTIPFELECYLCLVLLTFIGLVRRKEVLSAVIIVCVIAMTAFAISIMQYEIGWNVPGRMLVLSFLFGVLGYLFKPLLPHNIGLFWLSVVTTYLCLHFPNLVFLSAAPLAYLTVYIGLLRLPSIPFGDLSYGIYLFHFPIARSIYELTRHNMSWEILILLTLFLSFAFALLSWRFIEKPVLDKKRDILASVGLITNWFSNIHGNIYVRK